MSQEPPETDTARDGRDKPALRQPPFRFMQLEIWKEAVEIAKVLFTVADRLEERRRFRFAEQLRGSALSMSNNIAEGSGSDSKREFGQFLNIARRSTFENANMIIVMQSCGFVGEEEANTILVRLDRLCRRITSFQRTLRV